MNIYKFAESPENIYKFVYFVYIICTNLKLWAPPAPAVSMPAAAIYCREVLTRKTMKNQ